MFVLSFNYQVIFLIGNKSDLDAQRDVTYDEAKQFAEENGIKIGFPIMINYGYYIQ